MKTRLILFFILGIDAALLIYVISTLSITYHGAFILFEDHSLLSYILNTSLSFFGQNDYALRIPMILMHLVSAVLLFMISKPYARYDKDRLWLVLIYVLLPGVNSAALLIDSAGLVLMLLFFYVYIHQIKPKYADLLLPFYLFIDSSFVWLFSGLFFYALNKKQNYKMVFGLVLFVLSLYLFGFDTHGSPKGHFLDTLGLYAAVFSPIVFIYLFYVLYRQYFSSKRDMIWYLSATALSLSLLLSFRQRIALESFAPYLMLALPLGMQMFYHSYRVRLKQFRRKYRLFFWVSFCLLVINAVAVLFNQHLYYFVDNTKRHFAYKAHVAKELALALKNENIHCVNVVNGRRMQLRLRFYGIDYCKDILLLEDSADGGKDVTVSYMNKQLAHYYVSKMHN